MAAGEQMTWASLPFEDEPLDSAVLMADGKDGGVLRLRLSDGRKVLVTAHWFRTEFDGPVAVEVSGYDDMTVQIEYKADSLCLRGGRVGMPVDYDEDEAEFRDCVADWIESGCDVELQLATDAEVWLGSGRAGERPRPAAGYPAAPALALPAPGSLGAPAPAESRLRKLVAM